MPKTGQAGRQSRRLRGDSTTCGVPFGRKHSTSAASFDFLIPVAFERCQQHAVKTGKFGPNLSSSGYRRQSGGDAFAHHPHRRQAAFLVDSLSPDAFGTANSATKAASLTVGAG